LSMAWQSVRKFPVDLDIWREGKQMLADRIFQARPPTQVHYKAWWNKSDESVCLYLNQQKRKIKCKSTAHTVITILNSIKH